MGERIGRLLNEPENSRGNIAILAGELLELGEKKTREAPQKERIKKYILDRFSRGISPEELASEINCSNATFYRFFKKEFGCTPSAYLNDIRLSHAALLLETTDEKISAVAELCGYENQYYFIKLFKRKFGIPPHAYRCALKMKG